MSIAKALFLSIIALMLLSVPGQACEVTGNEFYYLKKKLTRKSMTTNKDCSFENAGSVTSSASGNPVVNIGDGKVGQKIMWDAACGGYSEDLLFVDCGANAAILLSPDPNPYVVPKFQNISEMQFPNGPVRITKNTTVGQLAETAMRHEIDVFDDFSGWESGWKPRRRYDYLCGCKLYYPDSAGAKS